VPEAPQRALRDLTRQRTHLIRERASEVNRMQKVLEWANIKLAGVVTDVLGKSARAMLEAILASETDASHLAALAEGRLRAKRAQLEQALVGRVQPHHCFLLTEQLSHIDYLDAAIARFSTEIAARLRTCDPEIDLLDTVPGVSRRVAEVLLAEIGANLTRFPTAHHLASWAGVCPGNNESAGKRKSGQTRKGSRWLRQVLVEAAQAAARSKHTSLGAQYRRLALRRGAKKAIMAVAHSLLLIVYYVLTRHEPYRDLGANFFDERDREAVQRRLVRRLERLGYQVALQPAG
jgi:transposase